MVTATFCQAAVQSSTHNRRLADLSSTSSRARDPLASCGVHTSREMHEPSAAASVKNVHGHCLPVTVLSRERPSRSYSTKISALPKPVWKVL